MTRITRRTFITMVGATVLAAAVPSYASTKGVTSMYGLISKLNAIPGQRDKLVAILLAGTQNMPGCFTYIVALDTTNPNAIWITEVWESAESHRASLSLPQVQEALSRGKPLVAGFGERIETTPVGGTGLPHAA